MAVFEQEKEKQSKKEYAYQFYINRGYRPIEAAAIVGNLDIESGGFSPDVVSGKRKGDNGTAFGLAQWRHDRQDRLNTRYKNPKDFDSQLDFVDWELQNTHQDALKAMRMAKNVEEATNAFTFKFEKPNADPKVNLIAKRILSASSLLGTDSETITYNTDKSFYVAPTPGDLETSTTEVDEEDTKKVEEAKNNIAENSFVEDFKEILAKQQEQINQLSQARTEPQQEQQDFASQDMPNPYEYINIDPGFGFEEEQFQKGGVIVDDRGQWEHPGEVTKINSNNITMQDVDYPVLGISNTGDMKIMQPGGEYTFNGDSVIEYPQTKKRNTRFK